MARVWQLRVKADGDTAAAQKEIRALQRSTRNFGQGMTRMGRALTLGVTAPIVAMGVVGVKKLGETQKGLAQTGAVIKSTGGAANVTAQQISDMADAIANKTGVDDDAIQAGQNMLLTFTKIRNEAGKGNDVFNQSTRVLADMSVAMGKDPKNAAVMLGKALNDPVKGVTALGKAGVQFTASQKNTIKSLVDSGKTMDAQKLILKELNTQFGGSAEAFGKTLPGRMSVLKQNFEDLSASIILNLVPAFERIMGWVQRGMDMFNGLSESTRRYASIGLVLAAALGPVLMIAGSLVTASAALIPVIAAVSLPMIAVAAAAVGLGVALVIAYRKSEAFRSIVQRAFFQVRSTVVGVLSELRATLGVWSGWARAIWAKVGTDAMAVLGPAFAVIRTIIGTALQNARSVVMAVLALMRGDWSRSWDLLKGIVSRTLAAVASVIRNGAATLVAAVKLIGTGIAALGSQFYSWGRELGAKVISGIKNYISANAAGLASSIAGSLTGPVGSAIDKVASAASRSVVGKKSGGTSEKASASLNRANAQARIDASAVLSHQQALRQYNAQVDALAAARKILDPKKRMAAVAAAQSKLDSLAANLVDKKAAMIRAATDRAEAEKDAADAETERVREAAADAASTAQGAADQAAQDARDAENFRRRALGMSSVEEEIELARANEIRAQHGLPPVRSMSDISTHPTNVSGASSAAGVVSGTGAGDSGAGFNQLLPTSASATAAVTSAAMRALGGLTINMTGDDPEAVARRVAFIMGGTRLRMGGAT